ncbi:hypothetical protein GE21DRAFT_1131548 [Neurospora crassa]|nr:hypothetical protein GE21DRAFT_1131548 [Neurospora crassa]
MEAKNRRQRERVATVKPKQRGNATEEVPWPLGEIPFCLIDAPSVDCELDWINKAGDCHGVERRVRIRGPTSVRSCPVQPSPVSTMLQCQDPPETPSLACRESTTQFAALAVPSMELR